MANSPKTTANEVPQEDHIWMELRLLQSIVVQSRLGQTVLKFVDNFMWVIEKCAEWSVSRQEISDDENWKDSGKPELVRPLPWLLFLPSLVLLRVLRVTVNIGASVLNYPQITPSGMVKFMQICRRNLNNVMNKGMKEKHESKVTTTSEEKSVTESMDSTAKLKEDSTSESEEEEETKETLNEKLDRLALENSEDDVEYDPTKCFSDDVNSDENDESSDDGSVSSTEIHDIKKLQQIVSYDKDVKNYVVQFLNAEQNSALAPEKEFEPVYEKRSSAKESRDKVEDRLVTSQRIDSPECYTPDRSSQEGDPIFYSPISSDSDTPAKFSLSIAEQHAARDKLKTNQFINGEAHFTSTSTILAETKSSGETNNGAVAQERSMNVSKYHKGKRTSHGNRKKK